MTKKMQQEEILKWSILTAHYSLWWYKFVYISWHAQRMNSIIALVWTLHYVEDACSFLFLLLRSPALSFIWGSPFWVSFLHIEGFRPEWCISTIYHALDTPFWLETLDMWPFNHFSSTIEVVTFCLRGYRMLVEFLLLAFTHLRRIACVHRLDLGLYSHPKEFGENGVRTHVNSKGKIPCTRIILPRGGSNWWPTSRTVSPTHYQQAFPTQVFLLNSALWQQLINDGLSNIRELKWYTLTILLKTLVMQDWMPSAWIALALIWTIYNIDSVRLCFLTGFSLLIIACRLWSEQYTCIEKEC